MNFVEIIECVELEVLFSSIALACFSITQSQVLVSSVFVDDIAATFIGIKSTQF